MCRNITGVVILAGRDGARLRSLTRLVSGDDRPKQFCSLMGGTIIGASNREPALIDHRVKSAGVAC
jgi:mannose-1-phosphate guanylyltransferase